MHKSNVGIFIFDGVDILDLAGPFEVFSRTRLAPGPESRRSDETAPFQVLTIAQTTAAVIAGRRFADSAATYLFPSAADRCANHPRRARHTKASARGGGY